MNGIIDPQHLQAATRFKKLYSTYEKNRDFINVGAYRTGSDPEIDEAIAMFPRLQAFIQQNHTEKSGYADSLQNLYDLFGGQEPE
jgi:flagellum-specific ATP synthase